MNNIKAALKIKGIKRFYDNLPLNCIDVDI